MDRSTEIIEQARKYSTAVGKGVPSELIAEIATFARDAVPTTFFQRHRDVPFWYERLEKDGWEEKVGKLADIWAETDSNIQRATITTGRPAKPPHRELVRAFGIYRFKQISAEQWKPLSEGPGIDDQPQTVVCIALEDLSSSNGFLFDLQYGMDVCIDGESRILLPPSGGGKGILIWLKL